MFAIAMLLIIGVLLIASVVLIALGGRALQWLVVQEIIQGGSFTYFLFAVLRWVIGIFALCFGIALLYYFGNVKFDEHYRVERKHPGRNGQKYKEFVIFSPGAILATALFVLATVGFNTYISNFSRYNVLYGSIGTLIILMLWIWIIAILILAGNDLNSGIRRSQMKLSEKEDNTRRKQIVIEDLQKHIQTYQAAIDYREQRISALKKTIEEQSVLIHDMEEENRNYKLIIRTYEEYAETECKKVEEQYVE